ncbi:MAG: hypothetical protein EP333_04800 [Bacteroidetes bacterium]|nr:MAG: hypothetical protein EP333_04800 [Bacteroidota bacterium]
MLRKLIHSISLLFFVFVVLGCRNYKSRFKERYSETVEFVGLKEKNRKVEFIHLVHNKDEMYVISNDSTVLTDSGIKGTLSVPRKLIEDNFEIMSNYKKKLFKKEERPEIFQVHHYLSGDYELNEGQKVDISKEDIKSSVIYFHKRNWIGVTVGLCYTTVSFVMMGIIDSGGSKKNVDIPASYW